MNFRVAASACAACLVFVAVQPAFAANSSCKVTVRAEVAAIEHAYQYNRFGAFNPAGMIFALQNDLVPQDVKLADEAGYFSKFKTVEELWNRPLKAGQVRLRQDKRPRPLVLRVNEEDCLQVRFTNLLSPVPPVWTNLTVPEHVLSPTDSTALVPFVMEESEYPATRDASLHVNGLEYADGIESDGAFVGNNPNSTVKPGESHTYKWYARKEGGFLMFSTAATTGGEGDGGQLELGLFGSVNVEPKGSKWYRSQVTHGVLTGASTKPGAVTNYTKIDYSKLAILDPQNRILHSDLNAVIAQDLLNPQEQFCPDEGPGQTCGLSFREFTAIFHDEINAVQSFAELGDDTNPISSVKDGMGINYGVSSMGAPVMANLKKIGPAAKCAECKFEEFFLSSWANGDPALLPQYEDDPSNVHHAYLGDPVRFRNIHAGPKETHVFHLHAHQWLYDHRDPRATYLDSQTISPGASYTYAIQYGGAGNRNFTVGDSIFHCHLYPHFAQGMWALWRAHDVFEDGQKGVWNPETNPRGRWLPDGEITDGTPNPAIVPIPGRALAPLPGKEFGGYPFFIPGRAGHRAPQPPLDMDVDEKGEELSGGLSRHLVLEGEAKYGNDPAIRGDLLKAKFFDGPNGPDAVSLGSKVSQINAERVAQSNADPANTMFSKTLVKATILRLPWEGTPGERTAMRFHQGLLAGLDFHGTPGRADPLTTPLDHQPSFVGAWWKGMGYWSPAEGGGAPKQFGVNGRFGEWMRTTGSAEPKVLGMPGAPYADPCPTEAGKNLRKYRAAYLQLDMTVNKWGWHDPQARMAVLEEDVKDTIERRRPTEPLFFRANSGDCIQFAATNLVPSALNLDDFQIYSPTDILGQHIHLVKFDVTSSDGSENGWNYEDGTLSADEVRERISAHNAANPGDPIRLKTNPLFKTGVLHDDKRGWCADMPGGDDNNSWCGAQTTVQRWYADPIFDRNRNDRTMRTVFTHDHFGPSSHQHHGLYAALVVEPTASTWKTLDGTAQLGTGREDGGPTSYRANIEVKDDPSKNRREFNMAFADFALLYTKDLDPVNPPNRSETLRLPGGADREVLPTPEGISGRDPGSQLINYRHEPIPLRVADEQPGGFIQRKYAKEDLAAGEKADPRGDLANVFNSDVHKDSDDELRKPQKTEGDKNASVVAALEQQRLNFMEHLYCREGSDNAFKPFYCEWWRQPGDPATPLLAAYQGDRMQVRLVQGAQEEQHIFTMTGVKWLHQAAGEYPKTPAEVALKEHPSPGYVNAQQIGISEHMEFDMPLTLDRAAVSDHLYMSSATDNLWDGMWGLARVFGWKTLPGASVPVLNTQPKLAQIVPPPAPPNVQDPAISCPPGMPTVDYTVVNVGAYPARDLAPDASSDPDNKVRLTKQQGAFYNNRFQLSDPNAIVFVEQDPQYPEDQLQHLREAYQNGKPFEPLILRAPAGACLEVHLHNHLPADYDDRWKHPDQIRKGMGSAPPAEVEAKVSQHKGSYNLMPPLTDGLNINQLRPSASVGLSPQLLELNFRNLMGVDVGTNTVIRDGAGNQIPGKASSIVEPGGNIIYYWYAGERRLVDGPNGRVVKYLPAEYGAVSLRDLADPIKHTTHGAIGMLIVEPRDSCATYPATEGVGKHRRPGNQKLTKAIVAKYLAAGYCQIKGEDPRLQFMRSKATADIQAGKRTLFRDFALLYQDDLSLIQGEEPLPNLRGGDDAEDSGGKAFNYRTEPLWARAGAGSPEVKPEEMQNRVFTNTLSSKAPNAGCGGPCGDPETPVFTAPAGREVRFRVVHPGGHPRQHGFTLFGHSWEDQPWQWDKKAGDSEYTQLMGNNTHTAHLGSISGVGPARHLNLRTCAGGTNRITGDYLFRTQEAFQFQGGLWGIFRVTEPDGSICIADKDEEPQQKARVK